MTDFLSFSETEGAFTTTSIAEIREKTGFIYYHGTREGVIQCNSEPSPDEYANRPPPPQGWEDKIRFCVREKPPISVGRIIPNDMENSRIWSPVGLVLADGRVVGAGGHFTGSNGGLTRFGGGEAFPYSPLATAEELRERRVSVYELGVEEPEFLGIYYCPARRETSGDMEAYDNLKERAIALGRELNLPVFEINEQGQQTLMEEVQDKNQ